jgi:hypothetical protein
MTWLVRDLIPANAFVIPIADGKQILAVGQARYRSARADVDDHRAIKVRASRKAAAAVRIPAPIAF